jgi:hypothetical protein
MSWIIQYLLNNQDTIKATGDLESDQFNDLLIVEKAIDKLYEQKLLTVEDMAILDLLQTKIGGEETTPERHTLAKRFTQICERVAYFLGGYFTDEGYLDYMRETFNLRDVDIELLRTYIKSRYKNRVIQKISPNGFKK